MGRKIKIASAGLLAVVAVGCVILTVSSFLRTKAYFATCRAWYGLWPFAKGRDLPLRLREVFTPFVPVWTKLEPGMTMFLDPYDALGHRGLSFGEFEPATLKEVLRRLPVGGTFVDVGANIGWYSLKTAKAVGPKGHVIAVEPNRKTLAALRDNIRASGVESVVAVVPEACSDSEGTLTFYAAPRRNSGESSLSLANATQEGRAAASYPVRARRLDDMLKEAGVARVDAIKIDVEGAEFLVLKGATETLDRYRPVVVLELIDRQLRAMGSSVTEVMAFMQAHGYPPGKTYEANMLFLPGPQ